MHKNNAVRLALLRVGGRQHQADVQPGHPQQRGGHGKPRQQPASQRVKTLGRGKGKPIQTRLHADSSEMRKAAATTKGAPASASNSMAPSNEKWPPTPSPALWACTAPAPKISTGM